MLKKIISVLISSLCGSLVVAVATFDTSYEQITFNNLIAGLVFGLMYIVPIVTVLGIPSSILIDILIKNRNGKYKN
ncbi:hypothetical protein F6Y02_36695 (plasmid) [Bacillus megaterium]|nr:hypothetical protein [Priestia megaterium]